MADRLVEQTSDAFKFVQKLYDEISFLIKDVQVLLESEEENFVIGRPSGYAVNTKTSTGLEPQNVQLWIPRTFTVFFVPKDATVSTGGATKTSFKKDLRVLLLHLEILGTHGAEPRVLFGYLGNIKSKKRIRKKFENLMWEFAYNGKKIFSKLPLVDFEDVNCTFKGKFIERKLYSINSSDDIQKQLVKPVLKLYRKGN
jgi:hypothetical protein